MSCPDCTAARDHSHWGFRLGCQGCAARAVSRGPNFFDAAKQGKQTRRYRDELELLGVTHDQVRAARAVDAVAHKEEAGHVV